MLVALKILAVFALVALNGFFVAAEFALVKVRDTQLEALVASGHRRAKVARRILHSLDEALSATQLGITLASLGLGWIGEPVFVFLLQPVMQVLQIESAELQHTFALVIGFLVITFLHIVVGELAPKSLAIRKSLQVSLWVAIPLRWFYRFSFPFIWVLNHAANWLLRRFGIEPVNEAELVHSEEELRLIVGASQKSSGTSAVGKNIVLNALDLRHRTAREVMRPRNEITFFDSTATISECLTLAEKTRYSRFPVCADGDLDKTLGVVQIKDLYALRDKARTAMDLLPLARKLFYIPETAPLDNLLRRFLDRKSHFAVVVDEFGGTVGIVTLENTIEALVGQIQDEFDTEKSDLVQLGDNVWEAAGTLVLHDLEKIIGVVPHDENTTTVSGWLTEKLGGFPRPGDFVMIESFELRVEEMDGPRVGKLKISRKV
jgi:CBS domain containing-hemolysin-like protein